jgi:hypothetical protein
MSRFDLDVTALNRLQEAMSRYSGNVEDSINGVLHDDGSRLMQDSIRRLIPVSGRTWKGKKSAAKSSKSLTDTKENLAVTVRTTKNYHYLYFPDDGSNTVHHAGNQQFFYKGTEQVQNEIVERCVSALVNDFETT